MDWSRWARRQLRQGERAERVAGDETVVGQPVWAPSARAIWRHA